MLERALEAPEDIQDAILQSLTIPRYTRIYREGIFRDSTGAHTIRCVEAAKKLLLPGELKDKIIRILWIHDLPEIITTDFSVIQKESNPEISEKLEKKEIEAATLLLSKSDQILLDDFNNADSYLKGIRTNKIPGLESMFAKVIDTIDGNTFFHRELSLWVVSDEFESSGIPNNASLIYSFKVYRIYTQNLNIHPSLDDYQKTAKILLRNQLSQITHYWESIPESRKPDVLKEELVWASNELRRLE